MRAPGRHRAGSRSADGPEPDLAERLKTLLGCPILLENDCGLIAVAERWRGVAQDADDMIFVRPGNRTSAGLLLGSRLYRVAPPTATAFAAIAARDEG